jgi:hypothetical protein
MGVIGFMPDENWNPENFEYDPKSKSDVLGGNLELVGRSSSTITILSTRIANKVGV